MCPLPTWACFLKMETFDYFPLECVGFNPNPKLKELPMVDRREALCTYLFSCCSHNEHGFPLNLIHFLQKIRRLVSGTLVDLFSRFSSCSVSHLLVHDNYIVLEVCGGVLNSARDTLLAMINVQLLQFKVQFSSICEKVSKENLVLPKDRKGVFGGS